MPVTNVCVDGGGPNSYAMYWGNPHAADGGEGNPRSVISQKRKRDRSEHDRPSKKALIIALIQEEVPDLRERRAQGKCDIAYTRNSD